MAEVIDTHQSIEGEDKTSLEDMYAESNETVQNPNSSEENQSNEAGKLDVNVDQPPANTLNGDLKRVKEDGGDREEVDGGSKKQKVQTSVEEERPENLWGNDEKDEKSGPVDLGPKSFSSSEDMFNYFFKFLHHWPPNLNVNKYEFMVLLDLLKKGHAEIEKKLGGGVSAFQVRYHPMWKSRCFFLLRHDESVDDFSFRKCVDHILPLPDNMKASSLASKALGGSHNNGRGGRGGGGGRGRGGHGRGRGGRWRN